MTVADLQLKIPYNYEKVVPFVSDRSKQKQLLTSSSQLTDFDFIC